MSKKKPVKKPVKKAPTKKYKTEKSPVMTFVFKPKGFHLEAKSVTLNHLMAAHHELGNMIDGALRGEK